MRAVIQRVRQAEVRIDGLTTAAIGQGLLVFVGIHQTDGQAEIAWMADKLVHLRIFEDQLGKMNHSLAEIGAAMLLVSQFTLYGDCRKGRRPGFSEAAPPQFAAELYQQLIEAVRRVRLLAGMSYAAFALMNQGLVLHGGAARTNAWVFACAALISVPLAAWWSGPATIGASGWAVVVYLGVIATGLAYWLFSHGLRGLSAATGVALSKAEPVMAFALAVAVVGERPAWWSVLGLLAVIGGLWLVVQAEMRH